MLQQQFENYDYVPEFYGIHMNNLHIDYGNGWYGVTIDNEYVGWDSFNTGAGWTFLGIECINYSLILNIRN